MKQKMEDLLQMVNLKVIVLTIVNQVVIVHLIGIKSKVKIMVLMHNTIQKKILIIILHLKEMVQNLIYV